MDKEVIFSFDDIGNVAESDIENVLEKENSSLLLDVDVYSIVNQFTLSKNVVPFLTGR